MTRRKAITILSLSLGLAGACSNSSPGRSPDAGAKSFPWQLDAAASVGDGDSGLQTSDSGNSAYVSSGADTGTAGDASNPGNPADGSTPHFDAGSVPVSHCKRGMAYGQNSKADLSALKAGVAWWYNWTYQPDDALRDGSYKAMGVEYVPMVWGASFDVNTVSAGIPSGAKFLLGFNEPNFPPPQSNISAAQAASLWPNVEKVADARGLTLVSPAVNYCGGNCQDTDPLHYLDSFFAACQGCRVDKVAFHIYVSCNQSGANKAQWLINHIQEYKGRFSQPLWLTEFSCTDAANFDEQIAFMKDAVAYLENEPRIERYAWFSGRFQNIPYVSLLGSDGQLTPLGQAYVDAAASSDCQR